jgi:hypothetical protein
MSLAPLVTQRRRGIVLLPTLAAACGEGFSVADVASLSDGEVTEVTESELLKQQGINVLLAKQIRREVAAERERVRLEAEDEDAQARGAAALDASAAAWRPDLHHGHQRHAEPVRIHVQFYSNPSRVQLSQAELEDESEER